MGSETTMLSQCAKCKGDLTLMHMQLQRRTLTANQRKSPATKLAPNKALREKENRSLVSKLLRPQRLPHLIVQEQAVQHLEHQAAVVSLQPKSTGRSTLRVPSQRKRSRDTWREDQSLPMTSWRSLRVRRQRWTRSEWWRCSISSSRAWRTSRNRLSRGRCICHWKQHKRKEPNRFKWHHYHNL